MPALQSDKHHVCLSRGTRLLLHRRATVHPDSRKRPKPQRPTVGTGASSREGAANEGPEPEGTTKHRHHLSFRGGGLSAPSRHGQATADTWVLTALTTLLRLLETTSARSHPLPELLCLQLPEPIPFPQHEADLALLASTFVSDPVNCGLVSRARCPSAGARCPLQPPACSTARPGPVVPLSYRKALPVSWP